MRPIWMLLVALLSMSPQFAMATAATDTVEHCVEISRIYRDSRLFEEAKEVLIKRFSEAPDGPGSDAIYYELGVVLFMEGEADAAVAQWSKVVEKFPQSEYARSVTDILGELSMRADLRFGRNLEELTFNQQLDFSMKLWNFEDIENKADWEDLQDPWRAYLFYEQMLSRYPAPDMQVAVLYLQFVLVSGSNSDDFGYRHRSSNSSSNKALLVHCLGYDPWARIQAMPVAQRIEEANSLDALRQVALEAECQRILSKMEMVDSRSWEVADAYFRMATLTSGSAFWSGSLRVNEVSKKYFSKVLELMPPEQMNYRRVFTAFWLGEYDERIKSAAADAAAAEAAVPVKSRKRSED